MTTRSRLAILLLGLAALGSRANAQQLQSVHGVVRDTAGKPLAGADVLLGSRQASTGLTGRFAFDSLKPGKYPITIRLVGYHAVHSRIGVVASDPTELEYFLVPAPFRLPTMVVESHRTGIYGAVGDTAFHAV